MRAFSLIILSLLSSALPAQAPLPRAYTELNQYVIPAPDQGEAVSCLFMASTGAMEVLLNKHLGNRHPTVKGPTDIAERFLINSAMTYTQPASWFEQYFLNFNSGEAILEKYLPFRALDKDGYDNSLEIWSMPENFFALPRIKLPKVETEFLFSIGGKYAQEVLDESFVHIVKEALVKSRGPVITIGNDDSYWHATLITGYDDDKTGECYELDPSVCKGKKGAFYVRDSFGDGLELRSYQWFIALQNSAAVTRLVK